MKILLIRHAEPDYSIDSLTPKGRREAALLAKRLAPLTPVEGWYCSPLGRAKDTAAPTMQAVGAQCEILPWLREFCATMPDPDTGKMRIPWDLKPALWKNERALYNEQTWADHPLFAGGTVPVDQVYAETCEGIDALLAKHSYTREGYMYRCQHNREGYLVLFCHMAVAMAVMGHLQGVSPFLLWHTFCMPPTGVTTLVSEERTPGLVQFRCFQLGDTSHLAVGDERPSRMAMFPEVYNGIDNTMQS